jgi:outer membrane immunogenic protein
MKRIQGMLATAAAAAALLAGAYTARADGMPPAPAAYKPPSLWTGFYVGFESGWDWDSVEFKSFTNSRLHSTWDRDVVNAGIFVGYQYQWRSLVLGVEANLIGNEFDDSHDDAVRGRFGTCTFGVGAGVWNCVGKITDVVTVGPRLGWVVGDFMPYATGGYAFGNFDNKKICGATPISPSSSIGVNCGINGGNSAAGTAQEASQASSDGWFVGGGLDWKIADHVVVGIDYRHIDLGSVTVSSFNPANGAFVEFDRVRGTSDMVMLRGSLLFGARDVVAPLK